MEMDEFNKRPTYLYINLPINSVAQNYAQEVAKKRATIQQTLNALHEVQLNMLDEAVEKSDMQQAKDVIAHIQSKK